MVWLFRGGGYVGALRPPAGQSNSWPTTGALFGAFQKYALKTQSEGSVIVNIIWFPGQDIVIVIRVNC